MNKKDTLKRQTPSQTIGPFFAYGLTPGQYGYDFQSLVDGQMVDTKEVSECIQIKGAIYDGEGVSIDDAMVELWQDDGERQIFGRYGTGTEDGNSFIFSTVKPKGINGAAPYINVILFMRGQLLHSYTRIYFSDEVELNTTDEILNSIPSNRRQTLIAQKKGAGYIFDIHMQGDKETVFFKV